MNINRALLEKCLAERHRFRVGIDVRETTEFTAGRGDFSRRLEDAIIEHGLQGRAVGNSGEPYLHLQVWTSRQATWRNAQDAQGNIVGLSLDIIGNADSADLLFNYACLAIQSIRDTEALMRLYDAIVETVGPIDFAPPPKKNPCLSGRREG